MENKNIQQLIDLAEREKIGIESIETSCGETDIAMQLMLSTGNTYTFFIGVSADADQKEISDQLYMFAEDFEQEFVESDLVQELRDEYEYTPEEISEIGKAVTSLYKEHLALINGY